MYSIRRSLGLRFRSPSLEDSDRSRFVNSSPEKTPEPFEPSFANSFSRHPTGFDWPNRQTIAESAKHFDFIGAKC